MPEPWPSRPAARSSAAQSATIEAAEGTGKSCSTTDGIDADGDGLRCSVSLAPCTGNTGVDCVTVELKYDQKNHPLVGAVPIVSQLPPETLTSRSVARVNS